MNTYKEKTKKIEEELTILDNNSYDTLEEAKSSILKYDSLLDRLVNLICNIVDENNLSLIEKEKLYIKCVSILAGYIGSADDTEKYETIFNNLYKNKKISEIQLKFFYDNLNIGRWE